MVERLFVLGEMREREREREIVKASSPSNPAVIQNSLPPELKKKNPADDIFVRQWYFFFGTKSSGFFTEK